MEEKEKGLVEYLGVIKKRKWILVIALLIGFAVSLISVIATKPVYRVESAFEVGFIQSEYIVECTNMAQICRTANFRNKIRETLSLPAGEDVPLNAKSSGPVIYLISNTQFPERSVKILNTAMDIIVREHDAMYKEAMKPFLSEIDSYRRQIETLRSGQDEVSRMYLLNLRMQLSQLEKILAPYRTTRVLSPAAVSEKPVRPRPFTDIAIGLLLGLLAGLFAVFSREYLFPEKS
ncbi:hypothetical protein COY52_09890 [Candidatus Desantisbacteria bacterium CG_4_10_14_0_8_um_filter_48_22]|uniref:Polysaccharide chain length determinant N-terminal domain-containing protein n=1 Tax=Candidatus Desantisbacteria bacterium CG_4_10_14_0_8_um_filter_48_22 TaxID=1974543 RepID=A0A2M7S7A4_9BACT|nr:MAG: hypothetical protein COY52_09890 [Candidatus Desantisbacteria bacterium CG_4_10_14_0_8_um_filter_48_22]